MEPHDRWLVFRGKLLVIVGITSLFVAIFTPDRIPELIRPLVVLFGVGFILMAIPWRVWKRVPVLFKRDDTWL